MNEQLLEYLKGLQNTGINVQVRGFASEDTKKSYVNLSMSNPVFSLTIRLNKNITVEAMKNLITAIEQLPIR